MTYTLGPFAVGDMIAEGGMGVVYAARHLVEGYDAALKVVPQTQASRELILAEIRTTAALNHPSVVAIFDYGVITATEAAASDREVHATSLWFAMERATRGTLRTAGRPTRWSDLRRLLLEVLDALAHAHARGCIHRDLKPANILLTERDKALAYLLADFGIAHVVDPEGRVPESTDTFTSPAAGTPLYMAPEQIEARWRDQGSWTDLYSLACVAWELATGAPVFDGETSVQVAMEHLAKEPGSFEPRFTVPDGFESWLRVLLRKDGYSRYDRAAAAASDLAELGEVAEGPEATPTPSPSLPTLESMPTFRLPSVHLRAIRRSDALVAPGVAPNPRTGTPEDWRPVRPAHAVRARTGLGLFGLREMGVQGRQPERDRLWRTMLQSDASGTTACLMEGREGLGKSRLLRWLGVRADELGVATVLHATHTRMPTPSTGVSFAFARHIRSVGLDRQDTHDRVRRHVPGANAEMLAEVLAPTTRASGTVRFGSPSERYRVMADFLVRLTKHRPVLLLFDDVQWGSDTLGFVEFLLDERIPAPITVVLAVDPVELAKRPLAQRRVEALRRGSDVQHLLMLPLSQNDHHTLVREQAGLVEELAADLVAMSGGDTNYSLCLLADWVDRGVLQPGPDGYGLVPGAMVEYPRHAAEAWGARIDRFCARFAVPQRIAESLSIAAVLGTEVDRAEWQRACALRGVEPDERIVSQLVDAGLGRRSEIGFELAQSIITNTLLERAEQSGIAPAIHAACAAAIEQPGSNGATVSERRGFHLLRAGEREAALRELRTALDARMETSAYDEAVAIADLWLASTSDPQAEAALVVRARRADAHRFRGEAELAEAEAESILALAQTIDSARARGEGLRVLAGLEQGRGRLEKGIAHYTAAVAAYEKAGDSCGVARAVHGRGWLHLNRGEIAAARRDFKLGVELAQRNGERSDAAWSSQGLAEAANLEGDLELAKQAARHAIAEFEILGSRSGRGMALTSLGNVMRTLGRVEEARNSYSAAADLLGSFQSQLVAFALAQRAVFELEFGEQEHIADVVRQAADAPLTPAFDAVITLVSLALPLNDAERARRLAALRDVWDDVRSHPLLQRALGLQRVDLPDNLR